MVRAPAAYHRSVRGEPTGPLLLVADRVRTLDPTHPGGRAVLTDGASIVWVGDDPADAPHALLRGQATKVVLEGAELHPAFVDAHAHLTPTGLALMGLDLRDCRSVDDCLAGVRAIADVTPGHVIWGGGWDEFDWVERRPPSADELSRAGGGRPVCLIRVDGHSAVIDRGSLELAPLSHADGVERDARGRPTGLLRREAMHIARRWFLAGLPAAQLAEARDAIAAHLASLGVASVHEMGGPDGMGIDDFDAWLEADWPLDVVGYWGELDLDVVLARGLRQAGGALHLDGTIGSGTAALHEDYADGRGRGHLYRDVDELVAFATRATRAGVQVAFHSIGERAVDQAIEAFETVEAAVGSAALRACRPRLEHVPLLSAAQIGALARLGVVAVCCPTSERRWGGPGGVYEHRLGAERARATHPLRPLHAAGVTLAFGSGTDLVPTVPWESVAAAVGHGREDLALDEDTALLAATRGSRLAARDDGSGVVRPGMRADLAATELGPDRREAVLTLVRGTLAHDRVGGLP